MLKKTVVAAVALIWIGTAFAFDMSLDEIRAEARTDLKQAQLHVVTFTRAHSNEPKVVAEGHFVAAQLFVKAGSLNNAKIMLRAARNADPALSRVPVDQLKVVEEALK